MKTRKKLLSLALTLCMVLTLLPVSASAAVGIGNPSDLQAAANLGGTQVYFGVHNGNPIPWYVVDTDGTTATLWMQGYRGPIEYNTPDENHMNWSGSTVCAWLNGSSFLGSVFNEAEQNAISPYGATESTNDHDDIDISQKIVLPSVEEVQNGGTWEFNQSDRARGGNWWLRSPGNSDSFAAVVNDAGSVSSYGDNVNYDGIAVRPALNLNLSSVLFTSDAAGGKSTAAVGGGLVGATAPTGAVKLTVLDDYNAGTNPTGLSLNVANTTARTAEQGDTINIPYTNAQTGAGRSVSVLICDTSGAPLYYGRPVDCTSTNASGTASFTVPAGLVPGSYTIKIFNEEVNGDNYTDFASTPVEISLTVGKEVTYWDPYFDNGAGSDPGKAVLSPVATILTDNPTGTTTLTDGWYFVDRDADIAIENLTINGDVTLILGKESVLTISDTLTINTGKSLSVYIEVNPSETSYDQSAAEDWGCIVIPENAAIENSGSLTLNGWGSEYVVGGILLNDGEIHNREGGDINSNIRTISGDGTMTDHTAARVLDKFLPVLSGTNTSVDPKTAFYAFDTVIDYKCFTYAYVEKHSSGGWVSAIRKEGNYNPTISGNYIGGYNGIEYDYKFRVSNPLGYGNEYSLGKYTPDVAPANVISITPSGTAAPLAGDIVITFDCSVANFYTGSYLILSDGTTDTVLTGTLSGTRMLFTAPYSGLKSATRYTVTLKDFRHSNYGTTVFFPETSYTFTTVGGGNSTGGDPYTPPAQKTTPINDVDVNYTIDDSGVVTLRPTPQQLDKLLAGIGGNGVLNVSVSGISGMKSAMIEIDLTKLIASDKLQVFVFNVLGHEVRFPVGSLESMRKLAKTLRFGVAPGSIVFDLTDASGKAINWYDYQNPVTVSMPFTAPQDISTHQIVMIDKSDDTTIPRSWYADGSAYAKVCESGTYDAKIVPLASFTDTDGRWMAEAVGYMGARGIVEGVGGDLFDAQGVITRAHFVTMLMRSLNISDIPTKRSIPVADYESVPNWAKSHVIIADALGLTLADKDGNFNPDAPILRQDMFFMAYEAMGACGMLPENYTMQWVIFTDWDDVEATHVDAIQNLAKLKLVNGNGDGTLNPNGESTRSEGAQFLYNILKYDAK